MLPGVIVTCTVPESESGGRPPAKYGPCALTPSIVTMPLEASIQPESPVATRRSTTPTTVALPCSTIAWPTPASPGVSARSVNPAGIWIGAGWVVPV